MKELIIGSHRHKRTEVLEGLPDLSNFSPFELEVLGIIKKWHESKAHFTIPTSGSTGSGKQITLTREQLQASAEITLSTLGIQPGSTALLCLDTKHIAGLMMVVRAIVGDLDLVVVQPSADPFLDLDPSISIDLMAIVPYQAHHIFNQMANYGQLIDNCSAILIGGGPINIDLEKKMSLTRAPVYHTFGMTESASHFAFRRINGPEATIDYVALPETEIGIDDRGCLTVRGPMTKGDLLITNEIAELSGHNKFRWIGRIDHVVNTGGIKVYPEQIEAVITEWLRSKNITNNVFVCGLPDIKYGERLCLGIEGITLPMEKDKLMEGLAKILPKYHVPREIVPMMHFRYTSNGKIKRHATLDLINLS